MKHLITIAILFFALNIGAQATDAKIYVKGNYFFIEKDDRIYEGLSKEVLVKKLTPTSTEFFFSNVNNWLGQGIELVNILDESGTAYTTASWEAFYTENTGSFSNGGGSGVGLNLTEHFQIKRMFESAEIRESLPKERSEEISGTSPDSWFHEFF